MIPFERRFLNLDEKLREKKVEGIVILNEGKSNAANFTYLTGIINPETEAFIYTKERQILVTHCLYDRFEDSSWQRGTSLEVLRYSRGSLIEELRQVLASLQIKRVGIDAKTTSINTLNELKKTPGSIDILPLIDVVESLRVYKDSYEVEMLTKAATLTHEAFDKVVNELKPGMTEIEVEAEIQYYIRKSGSDGLANVPMIVASGVRSAIPHGRTSDKKIEKGELVLLDFGARFQGYCADMTRVVTIGDPSNRQLRLYDIVLEAQEKALENLVPGIKARTIDDIARNAIVERGFGKRFNHGLGHGVGIEMHEKPHISPTSEWTLEEGMVVTIEPGIYIPNWGGIRIEDTVLIEKKGCKVLTKTKKCKLRGKSI